MYNTDFMWGPCSEIDYVSKFTLKIDTFCVELSVSGSNFVPYLFFIEFASIQNTSLLRYRFFSDLGTLRIEKRLISCYVPTFIRYIFRCFLQKCLLLLKQPWFNIFQLFMRIIQFQWRHFVCSIHQIKTKPKKTLKQQNILEMYSKLIDSRTQVIFW